MKRQQANEAGFTVLEMLVVIVCAVILLAVVFILRS